MFLILKHSMKSVLKIFGSVNKWKEGEAQEGRRGKYITQARATEGEAAGQDNFALLVSFWK